MVTVIIPTYKRADYIKRAIDSVLNQTYQDFELIIVDDNNPRTKERLKLEKTIEPYLTNSKIKFIQHEKNKNGAAARNTAINVARGKYITFLDDDDFYLKKRLEILVQALEKNKEYNAAYTGGVILYKNIFQATKSGNGQREFLEQHSFIKTGSNMFFRAETLKKLKGFDETFSRHQDLEIMIRFFRENKILAVNQILVVKDNSSRINELNIKKAIRARKKLMNTFQEDINKYPDRDVLIQRNYIPLLIEAAKLKNKKYYYFLKRKVLQYGKISTKLKIKLFIYSLLKNNVEMKRKLQEYITKSKINKLDREISTEIKSIIKNYKCEETNEKSK